LRVDLSTGKITREPTVDKYGDVLGGSGLGYKVLWEEVPAGVKPFDPANKLVFATGPLAGTGVPCNGRTTITTIFPSCWPTPLVGSGHMGGQFAAQLKYAGYDGLIIEGKAERPVWLFIRDDKVELRDARHLWGQGIRRATEDICRETGAETVVAAIGQAGEKLAPLSLVMNSVSHSAGGVGGVMGAKNLKAVAVQGSGAVRIAGNKSDWEKLIKLHLRILGANNQHVVPAFPNPQTEHYNPRSRWVGEPGQRWGAANPPITVPSDILSLNRIAFRTNSAVHFLGPERWKNTVRGAGCTACPIRCHTIIRSDAVAAKYNIEPTAQNTCVALVFGTRFFKSLPGGPKGEAALEACMVGLHFSNDMGVWSNYGQIQRDLIKLYYDGILKTKLGSKEYNSIPWDKYEKGDPAFLMDLLPRIGLRQGELGEVLSLGTGGMLDRWSIPESDWIKDHAAHYWKFGHAKHHANEEDGQCGALINTQYNRDAQCHSHTNFLRNGLPLDVQRKLAEQLWGSTEAFDPVGDYTPVNAYKVRRAKWALLRKELHDSLAICNWMGPWVASPLKERGYAGDDSLESKFFSLATGRVLDREALDHVAERIFALHRALTIRDMGEANMRVKHDLIPDWVYEDPKGAPPFTKGTVRMDREDMGKALDLFYESLGWDTRTGAPTLATYKRLGLADVGQALKDKKLVPGGES
jgi:aldehyde:ferredoxin oxidoreductase